jgi:glycine/D-amino acid oxidase-like deaminating enzyme
MLSYWEREYMFKKVDFAIIGSGIVGISTALELRQRHPNSQIAIYERGTLPWGASTKNAGFACFGSPSELLSDLTKMSESEVQSILEMRYVGLQKLLHRCGKNNIEYYNWGSNEIFTSQHNERYANCVDKLSYLNKLIYPITQESCFSINDTAIDSFGFNGISHLIKNQAEGQINTGKMMNTLLSLCKENDITIYNGIELIQYQEQTNQVQLEFSNNISLTCSHLFITTNGFAKQLIPQLAVEPARAQVLITHPIRDLKIKGTFHFDEGYYYFRNIDHRVLFGGGRNLDFEGEKTSELDVTEKIQNRLQQLLKDMILPTTEFTIDHSWAGIMGVGVDKKPFIQPLSPRVYCGVKMGGMGVAIGSLIGEKLAQYT